MVLSNIIISFFVQIICLQEAQEDHFLEQIYPVLTDMGEERNINSCQNYWTADVNMSAPANPCVMNSKTQRDVQLFMLFFSIQGKQMGIYTLGIITVS